MILGIDSSGITASVALIDEIKDIAVAEYTVNTGKTHSETLLPMIDEIMRLTGTVKSEIGAVAVAAGPGSFTGLRIGGAAAKGIASALNIPVIAVPTVDSLAYNCYGYDGLVCPIMDARRNQTYTGIYEFVKTGAGTGDPGSCNTRYELGTILTQCAIGIEELIEKLKDAGRKVMFVGDGMPVFEKVIEEKLTVEHSYAPAGMNRQSAVSVGRLGSIYMARGEVLSAADFSPEYLRQSQAERETGIKAE